MAVYEHPMDTTMRAEFARGKAAGIAEERARLREMLKRALLPSGWNLDPLWVDLVLDKRADAVSSGSEETPHDG